MRVGFSVLVLVLGGCGGSYCDKVAKTASECNGTEPAEADIEACEELIEPCNGDDQKLLEESYDCSVDAGLFECEDTAETTPTGSTTGDFTEDINALLACYLPLAGLSPECTAAMNMGFTTNYTTSSMTF
jgi:hypothetical protein